MKPTINKPFRAAVQAHLEGVFYKSSLGRASVLASHGRIKIDSKTKLVRSLALPGTLRPRFGQQALDRTPAVSAFSLLEIMVAVALLALIVVGLLAMFHQTQRAFRAGVTQVDILESARATMDLVARELQELSPCHYAQEINLYAKTTSELLQPRATSVWPQTNRIQEYFFLSRRNDEWVGIGYLVKPEPTNGQTGVGTLYRFETNVPLADVSKPYAKFQEVLKDLDIAVTKDFIFPVAQHVIHLQVIPYAANGLPYTSLDPQFNVLDYGFSNNVVPAYLDLELGVVEPRTFERYRIKTDIAPTDGADFLSQQAHRVQIFRQRIPIRTSR